jgi:hypothetical protein
MRSRVKTADSIICLIEPASEVKNRFGAQSIVAFVVGLEFKRRKLPECAEENDEQQSINDKWWQRK